MFSCANITRINIVVIKIFRPKLALFITNLTVFRYPRGIKLNLRFDIFCYANQRLPHFTVQYFLCFSEGINVAVVTVANIGDSHHHCLVVIAIPHAKRGQRNTGLPLFFDH